MAREDGVHTHMLMAMPAPNIENRCTMITLMFGRELSEHVGTGLSESPLRKVTLASQLYKELKKFMRCTISKKINEQVRNSK